jgi:hypothetical protein
LAVAEKKRPAGWLAKRREERRLKRARSGDSPQKVAEPKKPGDADVKDAIDRAGQAGFLSGGV